MTARLATALLWLAALLGAALPMLFNAQSGNDELNQLAQAWRLTQGERLYQEVWEFAAPLPLLVAALAFKLWGAPSLLLARLLACGLVLGILRAWAHLGAVLALRPGLVAWSALGFSLGALPGYRAYYHHWWALAFLLWALVWGFRASQAARPWPAWAAAGLLAGLATASTQSSLVPALAGLGALGLGWALSLAPSWRVAFSAAGACLLGLAAPWALLSLAFAWQGGADDMWRQVWAWPLHHYHQAGGTNDVFPLSDLDGRLYPMWRQAMAPWLWLVRLVGTTASSLIPLGAGLAAAGALAWRLGAWVWRPWAPPAPLALGLASACAATAWVCLQGKGDWTHLAEAAPLGLLGWAWWASRAWPAPGGTWSQRLAQQGPALALAFWVALVGVEQARHLAQVWKAGQLGWSIDRIQRATPLQVALRQHLRPGDRLWCFPSSGASYLYGGGRHASRYGLLMPTYDRYHGPEDYRAFAEDWAAHPPRVVVLVGRSAEAAVAEWGGRPSLAGFRLVGRFAGPPGEEVIPHELWTASPEAP